MVEQGPVPLLGRAQRLFGRDPGGDVAVGDRDTEPVERDRGRVDVSQTVGPSPRTRSICWPCPRAPPGARPRLACSSGGMRPAVLRRDAPLGTGDAAPGEPVPADGRAGVRTTGPPRSSGTCWPVTAMPSGKLSNSASYVRWRHCLTPLPPAPPVTAIATATANFAPTMAPRNGKQRAADAPVSAVVVEPLDASGRESPVEMPAPRISGRGAATRKRRPGRSCPRGHRQSSAVRGRIIGGDDDAARVQDHRHVRLRGEHARTRAGS